MRRLLPSAFLGLLLAQGVFAASSVTSVANSQATALPVDGEGASTEHILKVADLNITSDGPLGFTLTVTSGSLSNGEGQTPIAFQVVTVAAGSAAPSAGMFTAASGESHVFTSLQAGSVTRELYVRYTPATLQDPGTYSHVVSVLIADN